MNDLAWCEAPPRPELVARVRDALGELGGSLRVLARDVLGADARIDLVAADPDGRVTLVLVGTSDDALALVALALAQRAWVEARLPDWVQLAPQLGLQADRAPRAVLVAPGFSPAAVAAVRAADPEGLDLVRYRCLRGPAPGPGGADAGSGVRVLLEPERVNGAALRSARPRVAGSAPPMARFRSGLSDADLDLTSEERRGLD